jgi:choline dehydrogenase-like flavoprotein
LSGEADVCIAGAGAGGAVAAWALVRRGVRVLLLEAGPRFDPSSYGTHEPDWELRPSPIAAVAGEPERRSYESAPGEPLDPGFAQLASRSPTTYAAPPPERRRSFYYSRGIGVGGSTLHYEGEAHRFPSHSFRMRSQRGVAEDWPLGYRELAPYYQRVEELLGVAGDPDNLFKPPRGPYSYPAHPFSPASRRLAEGARRLGWRALPNPVAILPSPRPPRSACHYCNGCGRGCSVGAKASVDVAVLPEAEQTGRLHLVTGFQASHLEHAADGRITGLVGRDSAGRERRHRARAYLLATGAIETPRILLNSAGGAHRDGVGNAQGLVGRYLMETLYVWRRAMFERSLETYAGLPLDSRIWDFNGAAGSGPVPNGFVLGWARGPFGGPVGYALEGAEGFGTAHREAVQRRFGAGISLFGMAEQLPRVENRVALSDRSDRFGLPLARVETRLDATDLEVLAATWGRLGELAEASRLVEFVGQRTAYDTPSASHVAGTCRMGRDPARSVVDASGAVHGLPNLVIADASVLVTEGAGDSPSLTIQALALRSAELLAERAGRGEI